MKQRSEAVIGNAPGTAAVSIQSQQTKTALVSNEEGALFQHVESSVPSVVTEKGGATIREQVFLQVIASQDKVQLVLVAHKEAIAFSLSLPEESKNVKLTCLECCFSCCHPSKKCACKPVLPTEHLQRAKKMGG